MKRKIALIVLDVDGVLNNGKVFIDSHGREYKTINYRDLDSVSYLMKRGIRFALLSGENTGFVNTIAKRFSIKNAVKNAKDKAEGLQKLSKVMGVPLKNICYIGDSDRDAEGLRIAGISFAPKDATRKAKKAASYILNLKGGEGVVQELKERLFKNSHL